MVNMAYRLPVGSVAFVIESETLYVRVHNGFRPATFGMRVIPIPSDQQPNTTSKPLTTTVRPTVTVPSNIGDTAKGRMLHLVAANSASSGRMRGVSGADFACYRQARLAGLTGTYRAFVASKLQDLSSIVHRPDDMSVPIVNLRNQILFNSWREMFDGRGAPFNNDKVPIYSFNGVDVMRDSTWPQKLTWIGSDEYGHRLFDSYCRGWYVNSTGRSGLASSLTDGHLVRPQRKPCSSLLVLLCIENSSRRAVLV